MTTISRSFLTLLASGAALAATLDAAASTDSGTAAAWSAVGPWLVSPLGRVIVAVALFAVVALLKRASESIRDSHPLAKLSGVVVAAASTGLVAALQGAQADEVAAAMPQYAGGAVFLRELLRALELAFAKEEPTAPPPCAGCGK